MLQVYLYGEKESGWLDVDASAVLDLEEMNPLFDTDYSTGIFTLPAEFPWTPKNRRLFGYSERLENFSKKAKEFKCDVYDSGWPEIISGKLTILEKNGSFSYKRGKFNTSIAGTRGLFGSAIKDKTLKDLALGGPINWVGMSSREFATQLMQGFVPDHQDKMSFAPVAIEDFFDTNNPNYSNEFLAKDTVNTIVFTGGPFWEFGRPSSANPAVAVAPGDIEYIDYRTVPFLKAKFVMKKVFEEHDFKLTGDWVDSSDFDDLVLFNNYAIENYFLFPNYNDVNTSINPRNHVPKTKITDFIKGMFDLFGMYPEFNGSTDVKLVYRKQQLSTKRILNLKQFVQDNFNSTINEQTELTGYKLNYTWDGQDGYYSERVKDLTDKTLVATVAKFADLAALDIGRPLTTNDIAHVLADNLYYCVADATNPMAIKWDAYAEKLNEFVKQDGERSVDLGISTLCTYVLFNQATALFEKQNYLGTRQPGSYRNNKGTLIENDYGLRVFYIQSLNIGVPTFPVSFNHNRDKDNNIIEKYSLALLGDDGLAKNLHEQFQDIIDSMETVKITLNADKKTITDLDDSNCLEIDNVLYLPYKRYRTIPLKNSTDRTNEISMDVVVL